MATSESFNLPNRDRVHAEKTRLEVNFADWTITSTGTPRDLEAVLGLIPSSARRFIDAMPESTVDKLGERAAAALEAGAEFTVVADIDWDDEYGCVDVSFESPSGDLAVELLILASVIVDADKVSMAPSEEVTR